MARFFSHHSHKDNEPVSNPENAKMPPSSTPSSIPFLANPPPSALHLPPSFSLFQKRGLRTKFYLAQEKDHRIYTVDMPQNEWGDIILCDGEDEKTSPRIAVARRESYIKGLVKIFMAPMGLQGGGGEAVCEELRLHGQMIKEKYTFAVRVGTDSAALPEKFEWRPTGLSKIPGMGSAAMSYELVNMSRGDEVVAKFSNSMSGGIRSNLATFEFLNGGVPNGPAADRDMGDLWRLMAVMSFLRIWQRFYQTSSVVANVTAASG